MSDHILRLTHFHLSLIDWHHWSSKDKRVKRFDACRLWRIIYRPCNNTASSVTQGVLRPRWLKGFTWLTRTRAHTFKDSPPQRAKDTRADIYRHRPENPFLASNSHRAEVGHGGPSHFFCLRCFPTAVASPTKAHKEKWDENEKKHASTNNSRENCSRTFVRKMHQTWLWVGQ